MRPSGRPSSNRGNARTFAVLIALAAAQGVVGGLIGAGVGTADTGPLVVAGVGAAVVSLASWIVPWDRLPRGAVLVPPALGSLLLSGAAIGSRLRFDAPATLLLLGCYIVGAVWVGLTQPPRSALLLAIPSSIGVGGVGYSTGGWGLGTFTGVSAFGSLAFLGEVLAYYRTLDSIRVGAAEVLVEEMAALQRIPPGGLLGPPLAASTQRVTGAFGVAVLLPDEQGTLALAGTAGCPIDGMDDATWRGQIADAIPDGMETTTLRLRRQVVLVGLLGDRPGDGLVVALPAPRTDPSALQFLAVTCRYARSLVGQRALVLTLSDDATTDTLTGLGNRRTADRAIAGLVAGDVVAIIDLDHFKAINDSQGHLAGDEVLVALGRFLRSHTRDGDLIARYGGEEFLVVLRSGDPEASLDAARRLLHEWRATAPVVTFSLGASVHHSGDPLDTVRCADRALYDAKRAGRDRLVVYGTDGADGSR